MTSAKDSAGARKDTSLSPQTLHIQARLVQQTQSGRKHWDLYRWLWDPYLLTDAIRLVLENGGSAGLDGVDCESVRGREWEVAKALSQELRNKTYRPRPVRRVYIPKKDGRKRPLGIPSITDRVVQRALGLLLEPIYEQVFLPCSYGFRPKKSAGECAATASDLTYSHRYVLEADIESFFDHVSHRKLLKMLRDKIVDPRVLNLTLLILQAGFQELGKSWQPTKEGTPQGGPLSPLLANIYLHYALDLKFQEATKQYPKSKLVRFADDFIILSQTQSELQAFRRLIKQWMREANLTLKETKTKVVDMRNKSRGHGSHYDFLGFKIHLRAFKDNPKRFWIARQPSEKARKSLKENLKAKLRPNLSPGEAKNMAKSVWVGWGNYFRYGNSNHVLYREVRSVNRIVYRYLRMKYRNQRRPVPWRRLRPLAKWIMRAIRPPRLIPDLLKQMQAQPALL